MDCSLYKNSIKKFFLDKTNLDINKAKLFLKDFVKKDDPDNGVLMKEIISSFKTTAHLMSMFYLKDKVLLKSFFAEVLKLDPNEFINSAGVEMSAEKHVSKIETLEDPDSEREKRLREHDFLYDIFGHHNFAASKFVTYYKKLIYNNLIKNQNSKTFITNDEDFNLAIRNLFDKQLRFIQDYLLYASLKNAKAYEILSNEIDKIQSNFKNGSLIQFDTIHNIMDILDSIFGEDDFGEQFKRKMEVSKKTDAYFAYLSIKRFDDIVKDFFGKDIQIPKGRHNSIFNGKNYKFSPNNKYSTGWSNSETENDLNEINDFDRRTIEGMPYWDNGNKSSTRTMEFGPTCLSMMNLWVAARKLKLSNASEAEKLLATVDTEYLKSKGINPNDDEAIKKEVFAQIDARRIPFENDDSRSLSKIFEAAWGEAKFNKILSELLFVDGDVHRIRTMSEIIPLINTNSVDYMPVIVWLALSNVPMVDGTVKDSVFLAGDNIDKHFDFNGKNILYSIWKNIFDPTNEDSLISYASTNKAGERVQFDPDRKNFYTNITHVFLTMEANEFMLYYYDSDLGYITSKSLLDKSGDFRVKDLLNTINNRCSIIGNLPISLEKLPPSLKVSNNFQNNEEERTVFIGNLKIVGGTNISYFIDNTYKELGNSGLSLQDIYDIFNPIMDLVIPRGLAKNSDFINTLKLRNPNNWANIMLDIAAKAIYVEQVNAYVDANSESTALKLHTLRRISKTSSKKFVTGKGKNQKVIETATTTYGFFNGVDMKAITSDIIEIPACHPGMYASIKMLSEAINDFDGVTIEGTVRGGDKAQISTSKLSEEATKAESGFETKNKTKDSATKHYILYDIYSGIEFMRDYVDSDGQVFDIKKDLNASEFFASNFLLDVYGKLDGRVADIAGPIVSDKPSIPRLKVNLNSKITVDGVDFTIRDLLQKDEIVIERQDNTKVSYKTKDLIRNLVRDLLGEYYNNMFNAVQKKYDALNTAAKLLYPEYIGKGFNFYDGGKGVEELVKVSKKSYKDLLHDLTLKALETVPNFIFTENLCSYSGDSFQPNPILIDQVLRWNKDGKGDLVLNELNKPVNNHPNNKFWKGINLTIYLNEYFDQLSALMVSDLIADNTRLVSDSDKKGIFNKLLDTTSGFEEDWWANNNLAYAKIIKSHIEDGKVVVTSESKLDSLDALTKYFSPYRSILNYFKYHGWLSEDEKLVYFVENAGFDIGRLIDFINSDRFKALKNLAVYQKIASKYKQSRDYSELFKGEALEDRFIKYRDAYKGSATDAEEYAKAKALSDAFDEAYNYTPNEDDILDLSNIDQIRKSIKKLVKNDPELKAELEENDKADLESNTETYSIEVNPAYDKYNILTYLVNLEFLTSTVGSHINHPGKGSTIREIESSMFGQLTKRNVSFTAAKHKYNTTDLRGILPKLRIAVIADIKAPCYNGNGDRGNVKTHDGATYVCSPMCYLENNSLGGEAVGTDKKQFAHDYNPETGTGFILKTAGFVLTNARIRDSIEYYNLNKQMGSVNWNTVSGRVDINGNPIPVDITTDYNGNHIEWDYIVAKPRTLKVNEEIIYEEDEDGNLIYDYHRINNLQFSPDGSITANIMKINLNSKELPNLNAAKEENLLEFMGIEGIVDSNYKLWQLFGGDHSASWDEEDRRYSFSKDESSGKNVARAMCLIGNKINESVASNRDVDLFLKRAMIGYICTAGAVKLGAANINSTDLYTDPNYKMTTMEISTEDLGVQLDAEHHADDTVLSLMTLVVNALGARGYDYHTSKEVYEALSQMSYNAIEGCLTGVEKWIKDPNDVNDLRHAISKVIASTLMNSKRSDGALLNTISRNLQIELSSEGRYLYLQSIPLNTPELFGKIVSSVSSALTKDAIKMKFPGLMAVLTPSDLVIKLWNGKLLSDYGTVDHMRKVLKAEMDKRIADIGMNLENSEYYLKRAHLKLGHYYNIVHEPGALGIIESLNIKPGSIVWGAPGLGKTTALRSGFKEFLDFDDFYNGRRDAYIAKALHISTSDPNWNKKKSKYLENPTEQYTAFLLENWEAAKAKAKANGLTLIASTNLLLNIAGNDFDKVLIQDKFVQNTRRPGSVSYLDKTYKVVPTNKIVQVPKGLYFEDILRSLSTSVNLSEPDVYYSIQRLDNAGLILHYEEDITKGVDLGNTLYVIKGKDGLLYNFWDLDSVRNTHDFIKLHKNWAKDSRQRQERKALQLAYLKDLLKLSKRYDTLNRVVKINGLDVEIDAEATYMEPFELIAPKNYKTTFGLKTGDNLATIKNDPFFFAKRILERTQETMPSADFDISLKGAETLMYLKYKGKKGTAPGKGYIKKDFKFETDVKGNCYLLDDDGGYRYLIPTIGGKPDFELYVGPDGVEVIYTNNINHFLTNQRYNRITLGKALLNVDDHEEDFQALKESIKKCDKPIILRLLKKLDSNKNPEKIWARKSDSTTDSSISERFLKFCLDNKNLPLDERDSNMQKFLSERAKDPNDTFDYESILELGNKMYVSFLESLEVVASRTPAQSMLSFMSMRIVGFDNSDLNSAYVSRWLLYLQGSDYDIDKVNLLGKQFQNGLFVDWSPLFNYDSKYTFDQSKELPFPTGKTLAEMSSDSDTDEKLSEIIARFNPEQNGYAKIISYLNNHKFFDDVKNSTEIENIDKHNTYFANKSHREMLEALMNFISTRMYRVTLNPANSILAQTSIDDPVDIVKELAKKSVLAQKSKRFDTKSVTSLFNLLCLTLEGKQNVGIVASALKVFEAMSLYYYQILNEGTPEQREALLFYTKLAGKEYKMLANAFMNEKALEWCNHNGLKNMVTTFQLVDLYEDAFVKYSALLSLATDNAKDPTLSKIMATQRMIGLYNAGLAIGATFEDLVDIISSPSGRIVDKLLQHNKFNVNEDSENRIGQVILYLQNGPIERSFLDSQKALDLVKKAVKIVTGLDLIINKDNKSPYTILKLFGTLYDSKSYDLRKGRMLIYLLRSWIKDDLDSELPEISDYDIILGKINELRHSKELRTKLEESTQSVITNLEAQQKELLDAIDSTVNQEAQEKLKKQKAKVDLDYDDALARQEKEELLERYKGYRKELLKAKGEEAKKALLASNNDLRLLLESERANRDEIIDQLDLKEEGKGLSDTVKSEIRHLCYIESEYLDYLQTLQEDVKMGEDGYNHMRINAIYTLSRIADEMSALNANLKLNQGTPNSFSDLIAWVRKFESMIETRWNGMSSTQRQKFREDKETFEKLNKKFLKERVYNGEDKGYTATEINLGHFVENTIMDEKTGIGYRDFIIDFYDKIKEIINPFRVLTEVEHFNRYLTTMNTLYNGNRANSVIYKTLDKWTKNYQQANGVTSKAKTEAAIKNLTHLVYAKLANSVLENEFADFVFKSPYIVSRGEVVEHPTGEIHDVLLTSENGRKIFKYTMDHIIIPHLKAVYGNDNAFLLHLELIKYFDPITRTTSISYSIMGVNSRATNILETKILQDVTEDLKKLASIKESSVCALDLLYLYNQITYYGEPSSLALTNYFTDVKLAQISPLITAHSDFLAKYNVGLDLIEGRDYTLDEILKVAAPTITINELQKFKEKYGWIKDPHDNSMQLIVLVLKRKSNGEAFEDDPNAPIEDINPNENSGFVDDPNIDISTDGSLENVYDLLTILDNLKSRHYKKDSTFLSERSVLTANVMDESWNKVKIETVNGHRVRLVKLLGELSKTNPKTGKVMRKKEKIDRIISCDIDGKVPEVHKSWLEDSKFKSKEEFILDILNNPDYGVIQMKDGQPNINYTQLMGILDLLKETKENKNCN